MATRRISRGTCYFCKKTFAKSGMGRHLRACAARKETDAKMETVIARHTRLFHLVADGYRDWWLHLEMPVDATLSDLDHFLRAIWLECCGHLSAFQIMGLNYDSHPDMAWGHADSMDVALGEALAPQMKFSHKYDFGSTTELSLRVVSEREGWIRPQDEPVRILARNNPPDIGCYECGEPATQLHAWEYVALCDKCAEMEDYDPDGLMPLVNSPRAGVCGYTGPWEPERFEPR